MTDTTMIPVECSQCAYTGETDRLEAEVFAARADLEGRVDDDGEMPTGECPACGSFLYHRRS